MQEPDKPSVLIVGAGFSGLAMAIALQKAGIDDFLILEKADDVGGTWRENTYPGAECDVASALYSFSFEHNPDWNYKWSEQPQILDYLRRTADKYGLLSRIRFGQEVVRADYDEQRAQWSVATAGGHSWESRFLVFALGQLHHPFVPAIPGQAEFRGTQFHSARWDHTVDLKGKRAAVIGNAASALQFVPRIAPQLDRLVVFQRSANWVMPKFDRPYKPWERWLSDRVPLLARLYRLRLWLRNELLVFPVMRGNRLLQAWLRRIHMRYLKQTISDPELREKLIPDYPVGAKRVLFSDDYFEALARPNVELLTDEVAEFRENSIVTRSGREIPVDVVIYGTGFRTNPFLAGVEVRGTAGQALHAHWRNGAYAYLGVCTSAFPNLFLLYGPNTNLGHNSIILMAEAQAGYITDCIAGLQEKGARSMVVKAEREERFDSALQARLRNMVWDTVSDSWYKDGERITNNWPGTTWEYQRLLRRVNWEDYQLGE